MNLKSIRNLGWKNVPIIIVAVLVFFGVEANNAKRYAPEIESVLESVREENLRDNSIRFEVIKVYDGDTLTVEGGEKLRLIGIDAPEIGEPFATSSRDYLSGLVLGQKVRIESDKTERDKYGRLLVYLYIDEIFVNEKMVKSGLAFATPYYPDTSKQEVLETAEVEAKNARLGIWRE